MLILYCKTSFWTEGDKMGILWKCHWHCRCWMLFIGSINVIQVHMHSIHEASYPEGKKDSKTALMKKSPVYSSILVYLPTLLLLSQPSLTSLFSPVGSSAAQTALPSALCWHWPSVGCTQLGTPLGRGLKHHR